MTFAVGDGKRKRIYYLAQFVCLFVCLFVERRFVLQGLSMLRNILARPIIGKRESYHFKLSFCRKTFMFS